MNTKSWILLLAGLSALATLAVAQGRGEGRDRHAHAGGRFARAATRFEHARRFARELGLTEEQRALVRREAQSVAPIARAARDEAQAIRARVRGTQRDDPARAAAREEARGLRDRLRGELAPHGRALVDSLTPEQRARIEARLAARGRTFDVDRASARLGRWLARPRGQARFDDAPRTGR